ncbi:unnamed protein product [Moneuplotes crassus]|uniref:Uncharacterized protein n=1 Tax=Euplotes crassus TaxID=5936 RepID=A0AAD2DAS0_EUPCR|nr:unnamed protein product [Moneuplotes crassus]
MKRSNKASMPRISKKNLEMKDMQSQFATPRYNFLQNGDPMSGQLTPRGSVSANKDKSPEQKQFMKHVRSTIFNKFDIEYTNNLRKFDARSKENLVLSKSKSTKNTQELPKIIKSNDPPTGLTKIIEEKKIAMAVTSKRNKHNKHASLPKVREPVKKLLTNMKKINRGKMLSVQPEISAISKVNISIPKLKRGKSKLKLAPLKQNMPKTHRNSQFKSVTIRGINETYKKINIINTKKLAKDINTSMKNQRKINKFLPVEDSDENSQSDHNLLNTPICDPNTSRISSIAQNFVPKFNSKIYNQDSHSSFDSENLLKEIKDEDFHDISQKDIHNSDEDGIVQEMISDVRDYDKFRLIEKVAFSSRYSIIENPALLDKKFPLDESINKSIDTQKAFVKFQTSYIEKCKEMKVLPLPLLKKIKFDAIVLDNYQVTGQISKALGDTIHYLGTYIKSINLTNNNMDDKATSCIINGMIYNPIETLIIQKNIVGELSIKALARLIEINDSNCTFNGKEAKARIKHLELNKCIYNSPLIKDLMKELSKNREIEHLRLSSVDFSTDAINNLAILVLSNFKLQKLNLSWSEISSDELLLFLTQIQNVKHLQHLDISAIPFEGPLNEKLVELLTQHITNNPSLIHLNISSCNLEVNQVKTLYDGIKKSKSLLSVHLSCNIKHKDLKLLKNQNSAKFGKLRFSSGIISSNNISTINRSMKSLSSKKLNSTQSKVSKHKKQTMALELFKQNQQKKLGFIQDKKTKFETVDERIVLYRFLGHLEMLDGHVWKFSTSCWICDKWKYTCIIANPLTAHSNFTQPEEFNCDDFHQKITCGNTPEELEKTYSDIVPTITGTFSKWKCHKMIRINEFYDCLLRNRLPNERIYVKEEEDDLTTKISKILNNEIYTMYRNQKCFVSQQRPTIIKTLLKQNFKFRRRGPRRYIKKFTLRNDDNERMSKKPSLRSVVPKTYTTEKILKCINKTRIFNIIFTSGDRNKTILYRSEKYGAIFSREVFKLMQKDHPHLMISPEELCENHKQLKREFPDLTNEELSQYYAYATFMPPGDTKMIVCFDDIQSKDSYNLIQGIIPIRNEEIIIHKKRIKKRLIVRQFEKHLSVFKDWKPDTEASLKASLDFDFKHSKLKRFIKDEADYEEVYSLFKDDIVKIKEIFEYCIGISSYPYISWLEFCNLTKEWNIPDKGTCPMKEIDTIFITTNFEEVDMEDNPDKLLCRYEFYEILVRIANQKYIKSKALSSLPMAVARLLTENIFENSEHVLSGQLWREDYLWTINIDDLYKANLSSLKSIFVMFRKKRTNYWSLKDSLYVCRNELDINIEAKEVQLAFSLAKMTVVDEMEESEKLDRLEFVEYLEFIARLGQIVFIKNSTMGLYDKIVYIMQKFLAIIPTEVIHPSAEYEIETESDEEEYQ